MKFGQTLGRRAPPELAIHNIDYDDLKHVIKLHTSNNTSKPRTIPTLDNVEREELDFENQFLSILQEQHERINDFVHMKYGEIERRLSSLEKQIPRLKSNTRTNASPEQRRYAQLQKAARLDHKIHLAGKEIQSISQLSNVNSLAFRKILKKYRKWTKSSTLERRFRHVVLDRPSNLLDQGFDTLLAHYTIVLDSSRKAHEELSKEALTPESPPKPDENSLTHTAQKLFEDTRQSASRFDAALATYPLSNDGSRATYWIHPENLLNVQILLLRYATAWRNKDHAPENEQRPKVSTSGRQTDPSEDYALLVYDDIPQFVKRRSSETVQDSERRSGRVNEKAMAALRMSRTGDAMVSLFEPRPFTGKGNGGWDFENIQIKHSDIPKALGTKRNSKSANKSSPDILKIRHWFAAYPKIRPIARLSSCRTRFCGLSNSDKGGLWITLDNHIRMTSCDQNDLVDGGVGWNLGRHDGSGESFPHAILEVRSEGSASEGSESLLSVLDKSHYLERVRGFSLETHALYKLLHPPSMPPPLWLAALDKDIRKVPDVPVGKQQIKGGRLRSHGTNDIASQISLSDPSTREDPATSVFSQIKGESSATSIPATQEGLLTPKLQYQKGQGHSKSKKRTNLSRKTKASSKTKYQSIDNTNPSHYWNEYDDGSEVDHDDSYAIYVDPDASFSFPGVTTFKKLYEKCATQFGFSGASAIHSDKNAQVHDSERQPLIETNAAPETSEDSDDDDDSSTVRPGSSQSRLYSDSWRERLLHRCCLSAHVLAFILLIVSGASLAFERADIDQTTGEAVVACVLLSFVAAVIGSGCMVAMKARLNWAYRLTVILADGCILIVGVLLLVLIANPLR